VELIRARRRRVVELTAVLLLFAVASVVAGCRGLRDSGAKATPTSAAASSDSPVVSPGSVAAASTPTAAPTRPAQPSAAGCTPGKPPGNGTSDITIDGSRHYILHVPPTYDGSRPVPLVINLHGAGSNAAEQVFYSGFNKKADAEGFITITPDATGTPQAWNFLSLPNGADDAGFILDMLDRTERDYCIDPARVYSTGISSGAAMSVRLACSMQDRIAAIGVVAALWYPPDCPKAKAVPVLEFHGTDDPVVPFAGGAITTSGVPAPPVEDAAAAWAKADGCAATPARARPAPHVRTLAYSECRDSAAVVLYVVEGGGHTWPGASVDVTALGATNHELSATDEIWSFFLAH
jgi:polyhydroxybutyrate depolymerase